MSHIIHIVGFTGSVREQSYNKALLRATQELLPEHTELEILSISELPSYALEQDEPAMVRELKEKVAQADAVLIASPEYKGMLSRTLKNALGWIGQEALAEKPVAVLGIGRQSGTAREQETLRHLLAEAQAVVLTEPEVYATAGWEKFDGEGNLTDETTRQQVREMLASLVARVDAGQTVLAR